MTPSYPEQVPLDIEQKELSFRLAVPGLGWVRGGFMAKVLRSSALLCGFTLLGALSVKLLMLFVCWAAGHTMLEGLFGIITPIVLGPVIGAEGFFWFRILHGD